jgi:hypothetical protein
MTAEHKGGDSPRHQVDEDKAGNDKQTPEVATEEKRKSWLAHIWDAFVAGAVSEAVRRRGPGGGTESRDRTSN